MQFVPGSHREGALEHRELGLDGTRVLGQQVVQPESFDHRFLNVLKAGHLPCTQICYYMGLMRIILTSDVLV